MRRLSVLAMCGMLALSACNTSSEPQVGADGRPLPTVYKIDADTAEKIPYHLLDSLNTLRNAKGVTQLQFNAQLNAAALMHSQDMSQQNRPWHFGSDGSSPQDRVQRTGYRGKMLGELVSETYETELETLAAWSTQPDTRAILMDPQANEIGFAWYQEPSGKIWWTMVTGDMNGAAIYKAPGLGLGATVSSEMDGAVAQ